MEKDSCDFRCLDLQRNLLKCSLPEALTYKVNDKKINLTYPTSSKTDEVLFINDWIVIQNRLDVSTMNFERKYFQYEEGFVSTGGGYWLGLKQVHDLTSNFEYRIRFELQDIQGSWFSAEYFTFSIGSSFSGYILEINNYVGDASDAFYFGAPDKKYFLNGTKFLTSESGHVCSFILKAGWWVKNCLAVHLNAQPPNNIWFTLPSGFYEVKGSRIMIKLRNKI